MNKALIRVTTLEAFRQFVNNTIERDYYDIPEQRVIDTIKGDFKGNHKTRVGTAFHSIIETGEPTNVDPKEGCIINVDGNEIKFDTTQVQVALDYRNEFPGAFHEVRQYKDYGRAIVTGCADMINGIELRDIKTKYSTPSDNDYIESCQWKYYLDIFQADVFHFDLFIFRRYNPEKRGYDVRGLELTRHTPPITCYRYPDMESDNLALVNEFMDFAESRGLVGYLTEEQIRK